MRTYYTDYTKRSFPIGGNMSDDQAATAIVLVIVGIVASLSFYYSYYKPWVKAKDMSRLGIDIGSIVASSASVEQATRKVKFQMRENYRSRFTLMLHQLKISSSNLVTCCALIEEAAPLRESVAKYLEAIKLCVEATDSNIGEALTNLNMVYKKSLTPLVSTIKVLSRKPNEKKKILKAVIKMEEPRREWKKFIKLFWKCNSYITKTA